MKYNNILVILLSVVILTAFIAAAHLVTTSSGGSLFTANESVRAVFNISINNTDSGASYNISAVNITIPSSFTFQSGSNGVNASGSAFTNTSTVLNWNKTNALVPASGQVYFWFNATAASPGNYNITVKTINSSNSVVINTTNISVTINDTTAPVAAFTNPVEMYNSSSTNVTFSLSCSDNYNVSYIELWGNWSGSWAMNQTNSSPFNDTAWNVSVLIPEGKYLWGVYCNDSATWVNNKNRTTNRTLVVDTTAPVVTISCSPASVDTSDVVTCTCSGTDATSGINTTSLSYTTHPSTSSTGVFEQGCSGYDYAGNVGDGTSNRYTIEGSHGGSSGSSGGSTTTSFWTGGLYVASEEQFVDGFTREIPQKQRIKLKVGSEDHYVGVISMTSSSVTINVSSTPQQAQLSIGDEKKFEVNGDGYYDVLVKLNSIANSKANVTITQIKEAMPSAQTAPVTQETSSSSTPETTTTGTQDDTSGKSNVWMWVIIGVVLVAVVAFLIVRKK